MRSPHTRRPFLARSAGAIALLIASGAVLSGCSAAAAPAEVTPSPADAGTVSVQDICDRAAELTAAGEAGDALDLVGEYREGIPTPIPTVTRRTSADTPAPTPSPVVDCEPERLAALDALGQSGLAQEVPSPSESFGRDWDAAVTAVFAPLLSALTVGALSLLVLLLIARAAVGLFRPAWLALWTDRTRRLLLIGGVVVVVGATILFVGALALGNALPAVLFALMGIAGSLLLAGSLAARPAVTVEAYDDGRPTRAASIAVVAMVRQIGGSPPEGVEVPVGPDATALSQVRLAVPSTSPVSRLLRRLLAPTPWRVLVVIEPSRASVVITRNGRPIAAHVVDPDVLFPTRTGDPASATSSPPAVGPGAQVDSPAAPVLQPYLRECIAAAVVSALASGHGGFDGLGGSGRWQSIALHYIAATAFAGDPHTQRRLLAAALDADPKNLMAEMSLQYLLRRHAGTATEMLPYLDWLETQIESLVTPAVDAEWTEEVAEVPVSPPADPGPERVERGQLDVLRRLLMSYVAVGLNLGQVDASAVPDVALERNARRLVEHLGDSSPPSGSLRDRMRPVAGLEYVEVISAEKGTGSPVDQWSREALESPSPWVAFSVACYFSASWSDSLSPREKIVIERRIADRLQYALVMPELREAAMTDPVLARHRDHPWFIDLVRSFD